MFIKLQGTRDKRLLLIGPKPPPSHGTSVKFDIFCEVAKRQLGLRFTDIVNTQTGDKALISAYSISSLSGYAKILLQIFIKGCRADVIVVFGSQRFATVFGGLTAIILGSFGKSVHISLFGGAYDRYLEGLSIPIQKCIKILFGICSGIIVETRHLESTLSKVWPGKVHYVPNFRKTSCSTVGSRNRNRDKVFFLYVGVIRREKGIGELLEAFSKLEILAKTGELGTEVQLDLYGPVYDSPNDRVDLRLVEHSTDVKFHGEIPHEQVLRAYVEADVFVYPSYWPSEGHSGAVIEALMQGLPIIAADWRATRELVQENFNGLLCPPNDPCALAVCMQRMARDVTLRYRLAEGARQSVHEFDAERACTKMLQFVLNSSP